MMMGTFATSQTVTGPVPRRLFAFSAGFLTQKRLRRMLQLQGHQICLGRPGPTDGVVVWGQGGPSKRGRAIAKRLNVPLISVEDAFLRSLRPGRMGDAPLGLMIDPMGVHFDASKPSLLETLLNTANLTDPNILSRATDAISRLRQLDLSKYNHHDPTLPLPDPGYVLVIDQAQGDASLVACGADHARFQAMLARASADHPNARIVIKSHPETTLGLRPGHFGPSDVTDKISILSTAVSPQKLLSGASAVYTVSSQMGFEAILVGHKPHVFGTPFYAGWGLSQDAIAMPRRTRILTAPQLFAAAMILAPSYYDPARDRLCHLEDVINHLEAETRALRENRRGFVAAGMRSWKRHHLQSFYGDQKPLLFAKTAKKAAKLADTTARPVLIWAAKGPAKIVTTSPIYQVEDGFLRSRGLGAALIPPLSLVADDLGIFYDPSRTSRLEMLIAGPLAPGGAARTQQLILSILKSGISKYNSGSKTLPVLPYGHRILVPGQVEDDASVLKGAGPIRTNLALLQATRAANPKAIILYKPHPDVEAGLRSGAVPEPMLKTLANVILRNTDPAAVLPLCDAVWTMTSSLGFEALLRGKPVTCLGVPFYAGWGLTTDLHPIPKRRRTLLAEATLLGPMTLHRLVHAALIAYPRYFDPVTRRPCAPEVAVHRLSSGDMPRLGLAHRSLAKLQGRFSGFAYLWR